jgi:hypothetical protein
LLAHTVTPWWPHPVALYDQALPLGDLASQELVASLVHPPPRPDQYADLPDDGWVRSVQAFACVGLLHCRELTSAGNQASRDTAAARQLLTQLAYGVEDWVTEAALFGLAVAAWADPGCRAEVAQTVSDRYRQAARAADQHVVTILAGLSQLLLIVPGVSQDLRSHARSVVADDDDGRADLPPGT